MTGGETALAVGAAGLVGYGLLKGSGGLPNGLNGAVPAGTSITVSVSGFGPFLTLSTDSQSLQGAFEAAINQAAAGYTVTSWNVTYTTLTTALFDNQVPYQGTFTIQTTVDFAQGSDVVASISGYLYQVTGYTPTVNANGGNAGTPTTQLNAGGLTNFFNNVFGANGLLSTGGPLLIAVIVGGVLLIVWSNQKEVIRRVT